ncbi:uncharacterized protein LOC130746168 [Lotus japonicus]|uniref:uncharacterized protein LOC130746168 n=1 Tax=Lotus japonicus TaxID=34305 RepID=UPI00258B1CE5|nr:uncharacterized protein LOC130746168 [Lotus japonicus]
MAEKKEQATPLASAIENPNPRTNGEEDTTQLSQHHHQKLSRRHFIKRFACPLVFLLLLAVVIIVLIFTVFRIKNPVIKMNSIQITNLNLTNIVAAKPGVNLSVIADVSVKNPNAASFRYSNTTTSLYYRGVMVGEARGPPGRAKAGRTIRMNLTVDVITDRINLSSSDLRNDLSSGVLTMNSFSRVPGQVKILNLFKKHVVVKMNCSTTFNVTTREIQEQNCKRKVKI